MEPISFIGEQEKPIAFYNGNFISRQQFWSDVYSVSKTLKDAAYVINDCRNRYVFLVTFVASMLKQQVSLFPSTRTPLIFDKLHNTYPDMYCVSDQTDELAGIDTLAFDFTSLGRNSSNYSSATIPHDQIALIAFTSGTTGEPKPHTKSWGGFLHEAKVAGQSLGLDKQIVDRCLATIPAQHMYGFIASIMVPLYYGIVIEASCPFYAEDIRLDLEKIDSNSMLVTTPIQLRNCVQEDAELNNLCFILSSAAPLDKTVSQHAERLYGVPVYEFYGSTETGAIAFRETNKTDKWKTFNDISVAQIDNKLEVSAPYLSEPQIIQDYVEVLNNREFIFKARTTEIIKVSGKRTSLQELNSALLGVEGVRDGTFYQHETELDGRLMVFAVVNNLSRESLLQSLNGKMDDVFLPRKIIFLEHLPRTESGKLPLDNMAVLGKMS